MYVFCLDIGGTETRGALFDAEGHERARTTGPAGALSLGADASEAAIRAVWAKAIADLPQTPAPGETQLCAGIAGMGLAGRVEALHNKLADFQGTHFVGDGYAALIATTQGAPGALISVGTGVAALRLGADGRTITLSSWGFPGGDLGSGAWLGLGLTNVLTRYLDGIPNEPPLTDTMADQILQITGDTPSKIMDWLTGSRARQYASLAPIIVAFAENGDPFARQMLSLAAAEITAVAAALYEGKRGTVNLSGGLGGVLHPYCAEQAPQFDWKFGAHDPLQGAYLIATGKAPKEVLRPRPKMSVLDYG